MIILKKFSQEDKRDNNSAKKAGEVLGTAGLGTATTLAIAGKVGEAEKNLKARNTKKAKEAFKSGIKKLQNEKKAADFTANAKRAHEQGMRGSSVLDLIFHNKKNKVADKVLADELASNEQVYRKGVQALKKQVTRDANKRANKLSSKLMKNAKGKALVGGMALTGLASGLVATKKDKNSK